MAAPTEVLSILQNVQEDEGNESFLVTLPDELLLKVMRFLPTSDLLSLRNVNLRFSEICEDSSLLRNVDLQGCYHVTTHTLWELGHLAKGAAMVSFNISDCYWLTSNQLSILNPRMRNLMHLDIRGTAVSLKTLNQILSSAQSLKSLSYEHRWMIKSTDFSEDATKTWSQIRELNVVITRNCIHTYLFSLFHKLEAFRLDTGKQPCEWFVCKCEGPSMSDLLLLCELKYLYVAREATSLHPRSCTFHAPHGCGFQPKKSLSHFSFSHSKYRQYEERTSGYAEIQSLEVEDVYDNAFLLESPRLQSVQHLNIKVKGVTQNQLSPVRCYSKLRSLNISGCQKAFLREGEERLDLSVVEALVEAKIPLRHLNISGVHLHHLDTGNHLSRLLSQLRGLRRLSLPICGLAETGQLQPAWMTSSPQPTNPAASVNVHSSRFGKRQRVGVRTSVYKMCDVCVAGTPSPTYTDKEDTDGCVYCRSSLARIVNGNPWMECLELLGVDYDSVLSKRNSHWTHEQNKSKFTPCGPSASLSVSEDTLLCIARWTQLHTLVLVGLPTIVHGHCLVAIAQGCRQLRRLSLAHLGLSGQCQFLKGLCEALQHTHRLEDLRLEHPNIDGIGMLFGALQQCTSIVRLCIITKNGKMNPGDVFSMFNHCPKLVVLCMLCSLSSAACKRLKQEILGSFGRSRPALRVAVSQYPVHSDQLRDCLKGMPDVHLRELIMLDSKIATTFPTWRELETIQAAEGMDDNNK